MTWSTLAALLSPRGRASRRAYWTYLAVEAGVCLSVAASIDWFDVDLFDRDDRGFAIMATIAVAISVAAGVFVGIRRLHDTDRSGWYLLVGLLPVIGWAASLAMLNAPGTRGANRFGPGA